MWPAFIAAVLVALPLAAADSLQDYLRSNGKRPVEYVLAKLDDHRVVILGEAHWMRSDSELVAALVPELRRRGVALAVELFPAERQQDIDALLAAPQWDVVRANSILRHWGYVQYREILRAAWQANRNASDAPPMRIIALGPPEDWRARGIRYDEFMAQKVMEYSTDPTRRVLAYCGMHHGFTRYLQVERRGRGRATEFMDRFGNILWRRYAQDVFLIALSKPGMCGPAEKPESRQCLLFGGRIDCAASAIGQPVGFDILGSPVAELKFPPESFYSFGHPLLRFIDYADGYVWSEPIDQVRMVDLIPLEEIAPDEAADPARAARWNQRAAELARPLDRPSWKDLANWRRGCRGDQTIRLRRHR